MSYRKLENSSNIQDILPNVQKELSWKEKCPFGCKLTGLSPEQLQKHRIDEYLLHLDILFSILKELGLDKSFSVEHGENSNLETEMFKELHDHLDNARILVNAAKLLEMKLAVKRVERVEQMKLFEKAIEDIMLTSFNGVLFWIIPEEKRVDESLLSPIFYTGKYGYKLRLKLVKDNIKKSFQHLSLIFIKWIYDPVLPESFDTKIDIKIKMVGGNAKDINTISINLKRINDNSNEKSILVTENLEYGNIEFVHFKLDVSNFDISSVD